MSDSRSRMSCSIWRCQLNQHALAETYLVTKSPLLYDVHADVENILHELLALTSGSTRQGLALLLILAASQYCFSQHLSVAPLNRDSDDVLVRAGIVA